MRAPSPQLWLVRVRKEFEPLVQSALTPSLFETPPLFTTLSARLFFASGNPSAGPDILIKRIRAQKAADYVRRLVWCQGKREFLSSCALIEMGLRCPAPVGYAINIVPSSRFDSLFISAFLPDAIPLSRQIADMKKPDRLAFLKMAARDIGFMFSRRVFHKDLQLNNILLNPADPAQLHWIDNDLKKIGRRRWAKQPKAVLEQITRNVQFCSIDEKDFFIKEIVSSWAIQKEEDDGQPS